MPALRGARYSKKGCKIPFPVLVLIYIVIGVVASVGIVFLFKHFYAEKKGEFHHIMYILHVNLVISVFNQHIEAKTNL